MLGLVGSFVRVRTATAPRWSNPAQVVRPAAADQRTDQGETVHIRAADIGTAGPEVTHAGRTHTGLSATGGWGPQPSMIAQRLRAAAALRSPVSTMQALIGMAMETGPWVAGSIAVLANRSSVRTLAFLDARAADCDRQQGETGEGPAFDVLRSGPVQIATNLAVDERWLRWSPAALDRGIHRALTVQLALSNTRGTLNLYATCPGTIESSFVRDAESVATYASMLLASIIADDQLRQAVSTRGLVGQAQGILMHQFGIDAARAFAVLRSTSQQNNIKIVAIAEHLISTGTLFGHTEGEGPGLQPSGSAGAAKKNALAERKRKCGAPEPTPSNIATSQETK